MGLDADLEWKALVSKHLKASKEILWGILYDAYRCFDDLSELATDKNNFDIIAKYLQKLRVSLPNYRQFITVNNEAVDLVLQRYMLEAATLHIVVDVDMDSLERLSAQSTLSVIKALESLFAKILAARPGSHLLLCIKAGGDCVRIYASHVEKPVFDRTMRL